MYNYLSLNIDAVGGNGSVFARIVALVDRLTRFTTSIEWDFKWLLDLYEGNNRVNIVR